MLSVLRITAVLMLALITLSSCDNDDCIDCNYDPVPQPPQGVYSVTGNGEVYIFWNGPYEADLVEFIVWRSDEEWEGYEEIARVEAVDNPNLNLIYYDPGYIDDEVYNGETYFYAVSSVDAAGQISDLSAESVFDTPRPDGVVTIYDAEVNENQAGFDFSAQTVGSAASAQADIYIDRVGTFYVNASNTDVLLQPMGYTSSFDEIGWAPTEGYSENGWAEIVLGHTYVLAIQDISSNWNYAKLRVIDIDDGAGTVTFQYAYQTADNNRELVPALIETGTAATK